MNDETAAKSIDFIRKNRSYVINYNYGKDVVGKYITKHGGDSAVGKKWEVFGTLLSNQITTKDLQ
jgi:hypothetical protein